jgi:hypothetical protein
MGEGRLIMTVYILICMIVYLIGAFVSFMINPGMAIIVLGLTVISMVAFAIVFRFVLQGYTWDWYTIGAIFSTIYLILGPSFIFISMFTI